jgi:hypothetical protein
LVKLKSMPSHSARQLVPIALCFALAYKTGFSEKASSPLENLARADETCPSKDQLVSTDVPTPFVDQNAKNTV